MLRLGFIEHRHVADFLKKNGHYATESELIAIIRRLDVDADQKIVFDEWTEAIRPSGPPAPAAASSSQSSHLAPPASAGSRSYAASSPFRRTGGAPEEESKGYGASPSRGGATLGSSSAFGQSSPARGGSTYGANSYSSPARGGTSGAGKRQSPLK